jgi:peroxiredoxin
MSDERNRIHILWHAVKVGLTVLCFCCLFLAVACTGLSGAKPAVREDLEVGIKEGQLAPDFELKDLSGQKIRLSDYRGQVVLINFWATWCFYCRTEFPAIQAAYERNQEQALVVLAVNVQDRRESVQEYARELGLTFPVLLDPLGRASGSYRARGLPTSYFVDQEGVIVLKQVGPVNEAMIEEVLQQAGAK